MFDALRGLLPAIVRHLLAYSDLLYDESGFALRELRRRALGAALALAAGWTAVMLGCLWIVAASWNGPHRLQAVGALCIGFLVVCVVAALVATRRPAAGTPRPFERLRAELRAEMEELAALNPSFANPPDFAPDPEPARDAKPEAAHVR